MVRWRLYWSPRLELQGTYDDAWKRTRYPLLPIDWDARSLLCSPADQRPEAHLHGGELVELNNLTPDGRLTFALPKVHLTFRTTIDGRREEHRSRLASVIVEPDLRRVMMVWQTSLKVRANVDYLEETLVREKPYPMSGSIYIVAAGARTPVGLRAAPAAAAMRAGIVGLGEHPFMVDQVGEPMPGALDPESDPRVTGPERLLSLTETALSEACLPLSQRTEHRLRVPVFLGLPEFRPGFTAQDAERIRTGLIPS